MHPRAVVTINGAPVAGQFWEKLLSLSVTDREGDRADAVDIELEDGPPHIAIPRENDLVQVWLGYEETGVEYMGAYRISNVTVHCIPWRIKVTGEAADMTAPLKEHRERHWDKKKVGDIVGDVAAEAGLTPQVSAKVGGFQYDWFGQQSESGMHMLQRLADRHNALFTVKDGKLIFAERGSGETAGGAALPPLVIVPQMLIPGTCEVSFHKRGAHKKIAGEHYDRDEAKRKRHTVDGEDDTEAEYTRRHAYASDDEAKAAAGSKSKQLKREGTTTSCGLEGHPSAKAGRPMTYAGVRPGVDGLLFVIEEARHSFSKGQAYRTDVKGKLKA